MNRNRRVLAGMAFFALLWVAVFPATSHAIEWTVWLEVRESATDLDTLGFGIHPDGTDGIDAALGEVELPPLPPAGTFDARFAGTGLGNGVRKDIRSDTTGEKTYTVSWQRAESGANILLSWSRTNLPAGSFTLKDPFGGVLFSVDMTTADSYEVTSAAVTAASIVVEVPEEANQPPLADAGVDQEIVLGEGETFASVLLDGRGSSDPDGILVEYAWTEGATSLGSGDTLRVDLGAGVHTITLTVTDDGDSTDTDDVVITVRPPSVEVQVSLPDTSAFPGDTLWIPVRASDMTGKGVVSFRIVLTYSDEVLSPISVSTANTIAEVLDSVVVNLSIADTIAVAAAGPEDHALSGSGPLVFLQFEVVGGYGSTTPLHLEEVLFNEGIPPSGMVNGTFTVAGGGISGAVMYYSDGTPIAGVDMALSGVRSDTVATDGNGMYRFDGLDTGTYSVRPTKDAYPPEPAISAYDASLVLRHSVWLDTLDANQFIAGDVTENGDVTPYDAALILSYVVRLRTEFPAGAWTFLPESRGIEIPPGRTGVDFTGILVGDPSGDYGVGSAPRIATGDRRSVFLEEGQKGSSVVIEDARDVLAGEMVVAFDPKRVEVVEVVPGDVTSGCLFAYGIQEGKIRIAFAGSEVLEGRGSLVEIGFRRLPGAERSISLALEIVEVRLNEGQIGVVVHSEGRTASDRMRGYVLLQNHPNPFNAETVVRYDLPAEGEIRLCIYDVQGQRVRMLVQGTHGPGRYAVLWDGLDDGGRAVASGMYLYRLESERGELTRKMVLIR